VAKGGKGGGRKPTVGIDDLKVVVAAYEARVEVTEKVSRRVRQLQKRLGVPLFRRQEKNLAPTQKGERLYWHAKQILALLKKTERVLGKKRKKD